MERLAIKVLEDSQDPVDLKVSLASEDLMVQLADKAFRDLMEQ